MAGFDVEAIRAEVRALDFVRGGSAEIATWRDHDADSRANLAIEGMELTADEHAFFDMLRERGGAPCPRHASPAQAARSPRRRSQPRDHTDPA